MAVPMSDDMVNSMFPNLVELLSDAAIVKILTVQQKRNILDALDVSVQEADDTHVVITMLFITLTLDITDSTNPQIMATIDANKLMNL